MSKFDEDDLDNSPSLIAQIPSILAQRKRWLAVPAVIGLVAGTVAAFSLPTRYTSTATILVESADVPIDPTMTGPNSDMVEQRLSKVREELISRRNLLQLIDQFGLYEDERRSDPLSTVVETFRKAITVAPVSADFQQSIGGRTSLIAFAVSMSYRDAAKAQEVTQSLVDRVVQLDSAATSDQAQASVRFLTQQADDLKTQVSALESQLSGLKARNGQVLSNMGMATVSTGSGGYDAQIAALQRDNANLNSQRDLVKTSATRDPMVANAEAQLAAVESVYAETHPDVIFAKQRLAEAKKLAAQNVAKIPVDSIAQQIAFNNSQIAALQNAKAQDSGRLSQAIAAQSRAPAVMEQAAQLQQKLDGLNSQYQQVSVRLSNAQAASRATSEQRGDRLSVIDAPTQPDTPSWPNRPFFIAAGAGIGAGIGFALVVLLELLFRPIRGADVLASLTGRPPLGIVPIVRGAATRSFWSRLASRLFFRRRHAAVRGASAL